MQKPNGWLVGYRSPLSKPPQLPLQSESRHPGTNHPTVKSYRDGGGKEGKERGGKRTREMVARFRRSVDNTDWPRAKRRGKHTPKATRKLNRALPGYCENCVTLRRLNSSKVRTMIDYFFLSSLGGVKHHESQKMPNRSTYIWSRRLVLTVCEIGFLWQWGFPTYNIPLV